MISRVLTGAGAVVACLGLVFGTVGCSNGKPSLDDYKASFFKAYSVGAPDATLAEAYRPYTDCFAEATYDKLSADALKAMTTNDYEAFSKINEEEMAVMATAVESCIDKLPLEASNP